MRWTVVAEVCISRMGSCFIAMALPQSTYQSYLLVLWHRQRGLELGKRPTVASDKSSRQLAETLQDPALCDVAIKCRSAASKAIQGHGGLDLEGMLFLREFLRGPSLPQTRALQPGYRNRLFNFSPATPQGAYPEHSEPTVLIVIHALQLLVC